MLTKKNKLFDVFQTDKQERMKVQEDWGVKMSKRDFLYYEDQNGPRKMFCSKGVDPVWYEAMMRAKRMKEGRKSMESRGEKVSLQKFR